LVLLVLSVKLQLVFPILINAYRSLALRSLQCRHESVNLSLESSVSLGLPLHRPLHTPTDDADYARTAIQHFHEKLLNIRDRLKTVAAKKLGDRRHQVVSASSVPCKK
jgi:hypothetical protein